MKIIIQAIKSYACNGLAYNHETSLCNATAWVNDHNEFLPGSITLKLLNVTKSSCRRHFTGPPRFFYFYGFIQI